jgi:hypothetical protein
MLQIEQLESRFVPSVVLNPVPGVYAAITADLPDETAEIQSVERQAPPHSVIEFIGHCQITSTIDWTIGIDKNGNPGGLAPGFTLVGIGDAGIFGNFPSQLFERNAQGLNSTASFSARDLIFQNMDPNGTDLELEQVQDVRITHDRFIGGGKGLVIGINRSNFTNQDITVEQCTFLGNQSLTPDYVGAWISAGHADFLSNSFFACGIAASVAGQVNFIGFHMEENYIGLKLGNENGRQYRGLIEAGDMEADVIPIQLNKPAFQVTLIGLNIYGDFFRGHGLTTDPLYAIDIERGAAPGGLTVIGTSFTGSYVNAVIHSASTVAHLTFIGNFLQNQGRDGSTVVWDLIDPSLLIEIGDVTQ